MMIARKLLDTFIIRPKNLKLIPSFDKTNCMKRRKPSLQNDKIMCTPPPNDPTYKKV